MRELLELQSGQVAFISGLMSGFSLSIAAHVLRYGVRSRVAQSVFLLFLLSSLLFLVALYADVRLSIELAGVDELAPAILQKVTAIRTLGTTCATVALFVFVVATGLMGWLGSPSTGVISTIIVALVLWAIWFIWHNAYLISVTLNS